MELRQSTAHGIHILILCAGTQEEWTKVRHLAGSLGLTPTNTYKIVGRLKTLKVIQSKSGRSGGVRLAKEPKDISLGDVVLGLQSPRLPKATGRKALHQLHEVFAASVAVFAKHMNRSSLADVTKRQPRREGRKAATDVASLRNRRGERRLIRRRGW